MGQLGGTQHLWLAVLELVLGDEIRADDLRSQQFKTYIVSGGDTAFMRAFAEEVYGVPPEQVIGSNFVTQYQLKDGQPQVLRTAKLAHNDDGPGKPERLHRTGQDLPRGDPEWRRADERHH